MTDKPKLTNKQTRFAQGLVEGLTKKDAAVQAGYSERSASAIATENLKKPVFQQALTEILAAKGLTGEHIAERLFYLTTAKGKDGHADHTAQARALDMALKVRGDYTLTVQHIDDRDETELTASFVMLFREMLPSLAHYLGDAEREKSKIIEINK